MPLRLKSTGLNVLVLLHCVLVDCRVTKWTNCASFLTLMDTELKRTDVISGWNPSLVGPGRAELTGTEWGRQRDWRGG